MAKYVINYNPYQNTTVVEKNGSQLKKNSSLVKGLNGKRLQTWFDSIPGWPGIGKALDEDNNEKNCEIVFRGREIDFIDLRDYFEFIYIDRETGFSPKGTEFSLVADNLSNDDDMLQKLSNLVDEAKQKKLFPEKQIADIEKHMEHLKSDPFIISVIAPMSSGKSTLLNALMHKELLPTGDKATTANIVEIYDNDAETITYQAFADKEGGIVEEGTDADINTFKKLNANKKVRTVKIFTDIPMVSTGRMSLMLRDTPGPNNSEDSDHRKITESIISDARNMSTVLYIMNATQLRVDSDFELLDAIATEMKNGGKQANDRFLFVINRVDDWIKKEEQTLDGLLDETRVYLSQFGIENPRIFLVTAELASNIWKLKNGISFDEDAEDELNLKINKFNKDKEKVKFDLKSSNSQCVRRQLDEDLDAVIGNDSKEVALIRSGLKGLEYSIKEYMEKYAYPIKVSDAITDIIESIDEKRMRTQFMDALIADKEKLELVKKKVKEGEAKKEERLARKKEFEESISEYGISDEVRAEASQSVDIAYSDLIEKNTSKIRNKKSLRQEDAREIIIDLKQEIRKRETNLNITLKKIVDEEIYTKGTKILDEYRNYIKGIEEDVGIQDFDFGQVKDLKKCEFNDIENVSDTVSFTEQLYTSKKVYVDNPKYHELLWGLIHWGGKKKIEDTISVPSGTVKYVNREDFLEDIIEIQVTAKKNANDLLEEANLLIKEFKNFFQKQLVEYTKAIDSLLAELNRDIEIESNEEKAKSKHEQQLKELDAYMEKINNITNI